MKYVYAKEAGILPGEEITQKLNSLLSELAGNDEEKTLVFEKGEYFLDSANAPEPVLYITNTMGDGEWKKDERQHLNRVGMYFKGIKSLTVEGNSSVFAVRGSLTNIAVCDCENLYLKNFTLVTENPDMHAFKVVRKSAFRVDFELDCESRYEFKKGKYFFVGKDYERAFTAGRFTARWIGRVPASNGRSVVRTSHPLAGAVSIKKTGERAFRAVYLIRPRCEEGDEFYIFDIAFYQKLFVKDGFVDMLTQIQDMNTRKEAEKQTEEFAREQRRSKIVQGKVNETVQEALDKNHENWDSLKKMVEMLAAIIPYPRILCISNYAVVLDEKYMRDNISTAAFKYGGKITVVGYITNKVMAQANSPISTFSGIGNSMNTLTKLFFENIDEMYIVHPVAIYYDD